MSELQAYIVIVLLIGLWGYDYQKLMKTYEKVERLERELKNYK